MGVPEGRYEGCLVRPCISSRNRPMTNEHCALSIEKHYLEGLVYVSQHRWLAGKQNAESLSPCSLTLSPNYQILRRSNLAPSQEHKWVLLLRS